MSALFNNKYRIPSARLQNWNYANEAMYFVTICTKNRKNYFGEIVTNDIGGMGGAGGALVVETQCIASLQPNHHPSHQPTIHPTLQPTEIGKIAYSEWYKTIEMRPDMNLELGEFVVMPNHMHGIIIIGANKYNSTLDTKRTDAMHCDCINQFGPQSKNLASIIRGYKSAVTTFARKNGIEFGWQSQFYDHIIRSMEDYYRISNYILNNPAKWQDDALNPTEHETENLLKEILGL